jgi:hypothetical protein
MKKYLRHILILLVMAMILAPSCRREGPRMIPRSKLAKIYAEMFVTDQWVQSKPGLRTIADTSLVYEPILQKYGYDSEDYQYSIDRYMDDPERFSRILRTTAEILDKEIGALRKLQEQVKLEEEKRRSATVYEFEMFQSLDELISPDGLKEWPDSLVVVWDTLINAYRITREYRTDTIYQGPRMIVKDTVAVVDSLVADSLAVADSLKEVDSLKTLPKLTGASPRPVETAKGLSEMSVDTAKRNASPRLTGRPPLIPPRKRPNN